VDDVFSTAPGILAVEYGRVPCSLALAFVTRTRTVMRIGATFYPACPPRNLTYQPVVSMFCFSFRSRIATAILLKLLGTNGLGVR
jgi:hypothetical protein